MWLLAGAYALAMDWWLAFGVTIGLGVGGLLFLVARDWVRKRKARGERVDTSGVCLVLLLTILLILFLLFCFVIRLHL